eukprot:scaffold137408_cov127-Phaeocystis_antarctica.AAC.1
MQNQRANLAGDGTPGPRTRDPPRAKRTILWARRLSFMTRPCGCACGSLARARRARSVCGRSRTAGCGTGVR